MKPAHMKVIYGHSRKRRNLNEGQINKLWERIEGLENRWVENTIKKISESLGLEIL